MASRARLIFGGAGGIAGPMIQARDLAFAVEGTSEISVAGAAVARFFGASVTKGAVIGSLVAALILGLLGVKAAERNASIGIMLPFGM